MVKISNIRTEEEMKKVGFLELLAFGLSLQDFEPTVSAEKEFYYLVRNAREEDFLALRQAAIESVTSTFDYARNGGALT